MTEEEAKALMQILSRVPLTLADVLWLRALIARLAPPAQPVGDKRDCDRNGKEQEQDNDAVGG